MTSCSSAVTELTVVIKQQTLKVADLFLLMAACFVLLIPEDVSLCASLGDFVNGI